MFVGVFDEPTANCDAEMKSRFYGALTNTPEFKDKTIVVCLHDPLYLPFFNRVIHVEDGRVVKDLRTTPEIEAYMKDIALSLSVDL